MFFSCVNNDATNGSEKPAAENYVTLATRSGSGLTDNMQVYIFNGQGTSYDRFVKQALNIQRDLDWLKMPIEVGKWNLVLLTDETRPLTGIIPPVVGASRDLLPMWQTEPANGNLPDAPVLVFGEVREQQIDPEGNHTATCSMNRAASLVKVVLREGIGADLSAGNVHTVSLIDVPTTLSWSGKLLPNTADPLKGKMTRSLPLHAHSTQPSLQESDTVEFIIPAHIGTSAADTLQKPLKIQLSIVMPGNHVQESEVREIPITPKANTTLIVNLKYYAAVEVQTIVAPWTVETPLVTTKRFYEFQTLQTSGSTAQFQMEMFQRTAWSVELQNNTDFEFTESSALSGSATMIPVDIIVKLKDGITGPKTTNLILKVAGEPDKHYPITLN